MHVQKFASVQNQYLCAVCLVDMQIWCQALLFHLPSP